METTLLIKLETPLILGYKDPDWPLRPHEIWKMWKWWAKALVAGVLFERGLLRGTEKQDAVKAPIREEADCILQIVGQEMGLDVHSSCFQMQFEEIEFGPPREVTPSFEAEYGIWRRGQNSMLPQQGDRWYIDRGSATLVVKEHAPCRLDNKAVEASMRALALAFRLSCFGEGGRRGLGCFNVRAYGRHKSLFEEEFAVLIKRAVAAVDAVVNRTVSRCRVSRREVSPCGLPPMPALSTTRRYDACVKDAVLAPYMLFSVRKVRREDLYSFFSQQKTRSFCSDFYSNEKEMPKTWIINGVSRRPPPLMLSISGNTAHLSVFVSADWPLKWQRNQIGELDILAATARVLREFINYVEKLGGEVKMLWPEQQRAET